MAKKKRVVKRKVAKAKPVVKKSIFSSVKLGIVVKNLIIFVLLTLISYVLDIGLEGAASDIFNFLWIIFAFISVAFFLALLVLLLLKLVKR